MYRNSYQHGMLTVFFSVGAKPLANWDTFVKDGYISRFLDQDIKSMVLEIGGTNVSTTYMICPKGKRTLGIFMPFLIMIVKNLKKYFTFEVTILDETGTRRRFRVSNFQSSTQILPLCTVMPIGLSEGWNQIQFNLAEFTRRAYKKQFVEVQKVKINANIRLRRIYFTERLIPEDELPPEFKLYFPMGALGSKGQKDDKENEMKENIKPSTSQQAVQQPLIEQKTSLKEISKHSKTSFHSAHKSVSHITKKTQDRLDSNLGPHKTVSVVRSVAKVVSVKDITAAGSLTKVPSKESIAPSEARTGPEELRVEALQEPNEETINDNQLAAEVTEVSKKSSKEDQNDTEEDVAIGKSKSENIAEESDIANPIPEAH